VLQALSLETIGTITLPGQAGALAVSPGSSTLYATYPSDSTYPDTVAFVNAATLQVTQSVPLGTYALGWPYRRMDRRSTCRARLR
jgi:hypothetical protein